MAGISPAPLPNFRAVVGEQQRDRIMDETIRAILQPIGKSNPWDGYRRAPQLMRVQGNSKYVALRSVSTDSVLGGSLPGLHSQLPPLHQDPSMRGPGTPGKPTPRRTLMANKLDQIQGGTMPMQSSETLDHFHRFNKSTKSMHLRRGQAKNPTVQMQYILTKKPEPAPIDPAHAAPALDFAISAFARGSLFSRRASGMSKTSSGSGGTEEGVQGEGKLNRVLLDIRIFVSRGKC
jgi:hypothetical protein